MFGTIAALAGAGLSLIGNSKAASASKSAANAQAGAITQANQQAQKQYEDIKEAGAPGVSVLRQIATSDGNLTPFQTDQLNDARRVSENRLSGGGLRGSGRARVSALRDVEGRTRNMMLESNRTRIQQAAGSLAGPALSAGGQAASASLNTGARLAGVAGRQGETAGNRATADASVLANTIGDLAALNDPSRTASRFKTQQTSSVLRGYYGGR